MIKIKECFVLRNILDTELVVGIGKEGYMPNCMMSVNDAGKLMWKALESGSDEDSLVNLLLEEYEVDEETARADVRTFIADLKEKGLVEEC